MKNEEGGVTTDKTDFENQISEIVDAYSSLSRDEAEGRLQGLLAKSNHNIAKALKGLVDAVDLSTQVTDRMNRAMVMLTIVIALSAAAQLAEALSFLFRLFLLR